MSRLQFCGEQTLMAHAPIPSTTRSHSNGMGRHSRLGSVSIASLVDVWVDQRPTLSLSLYYLIYFHILMIYYHFYFIRPIDRISTLYRKQHLIGHAYLVIALNMLYVLVILKYHK
mgnify:CR=1 FL=1